MMLVVDWVLLVVTVVLVELDVDAVLVGVVVVLVELEVAVLVVGVELVLDVVVLREVVVLVVDELVVEVVVVVMAGRAPVTTRCWLLPVWPYRNTISVTPLEGTTVVERGAKGDPSRVTAKGPVSRVVGRVTFETALVPARPEMVKVSEPEAVLKRKSGRLELDAKIAL